MTARMPVTRLGPDGPAVSRIGLGLAALGRPAYITSGRGHDLADRSVPGMRARTFAVLDAAYDAGIRYVDAARSYGLAEDFLAAWLARRGHADVVAGSKWGYRYTGGWRLDVRPQEVKEHSLTMFTAQLAETRARLGRRLGLYQVHSLTPDSGLLGDRALLDALGRLRDDGVLIGLTTSGPSQPEILRQALRATAGGRPLFSVAEVTWNLLETSVAPAAAEAAAAGWPILVKEALANGRLAPDESGPGGDRTDGNRTGGNRTGGNRTGGNRTGPPAPLAALAAERGVTTDAIAIGAALANPWAAIVLSGAVSVPQLRANLAALDAGDIPPLGLAEPPGAYWAARAARPWR